jgi:hypothetical protein
MSVFAGGGKESVYCSNSKYNKGTPVHNLTFKSAETIICASVMTKKRISAKI